MAYSENCTECLFTGDEPLLVVNGYACGDNIHCRFQSISRFHMCNGVCEVILEYFFLQDGCTCSNEEVMTEVMKATVIQARSICGSTIVRLVTGGCWRHDYTPTSGIFPTGLTPNGTPTSGSGRKYYQCDGSACCRGEYGLNDNGIFVLLNKQTFGDCPVEIRDPNVAYVYSTCQPICDWFPLDPFPGITVKQPETTLTKN